MKLKEKLQLFTEQKRGLLATNFYNVETLHGVLQAAANLNEPIILQLTKSSIDYMGLDTAVKLGRSGLEQFGVEGWIHLDHGGSVELAQQCLDAGFDSVMIDGSELPFEENIKITQEVVKRAEKYGAHVEAELGYVAKLGQSHGTQGFTQPEEAKSFVEATGVDALAVAIGTAHGFYKEEPNLDIELLKRIAADSIANSSANCQLLKRFVLLSRRCNWLFSEVVNHKLPSLVVVKPPTSGAKVPNGAIIARGFLSARDSASALICQIPTSPSLT